MRAWTGAWIVVGLALAGCESTVVIDDGDGGAGGCDGLCDPDNPRQCPSQPPEVDAECRLPDFTECTYFGPDGCSVVFECAPVYPEAGAPSRWVRVSPPCATCPPARPAEGSACTPPTEGTCSFGGDCYVEMECRDGAWATIFSECPCPPASCDPGDTQVEQCPLDAPCYEAVGTCGDKAWCLDDFPEHGCPQPQPASGTTCEDPGKYCTYPTGMGCFDIMTCDAQTLMWQFIGGGCEV